jgi:PGF-pre-PGF domain-containing protein
MPMQVNSDVVDTSNQLEDPVAPASFSVGIDSPDADFEAVAGETVTVEATITNDGDASGEKTIALENGAGATLDESTPELNSSESDTVSLSFAPQSTTGDLTLNVSSEDDDAQVVGSVIAPAEFGVSGLDAPDRIQSGDVVDVTATVENVGDASGSAEIELRFGDDVTGTEGEDYTVLDTNETSALDGGTSDPVEFTDVTFGEDGVSEIGVASGGSLVRQPVVVEPEAAFFDASIDEDASDTTVTAGQTATVEAIIENVGGQEAAQFVEVLINGGEDDASEVRTLDAGDTVRIPVSVDTASDADGTIGVEFLTGNDSVTQSVTIEAPTDETDEEPEDDPPTTGGGGGGGGGGFVDDQQPGSLELDATASETVTPSLELDTDQRVATTESVENVESIAFDTTDQIGEVTVADVDPETTDVDPPGGTVTLQEIAVPDDATDQSATIRFRVSAERLDAVGAPAEDLSAVRLTDDGWETLETSVAEETDGAVTLEAQTPGFSVFAVNAVGQPDATAAVDPGTATAGESVTLDGSGSTTEYGEIASYEWSVADQTLTGETASATLDEAGEYAVELTVTNDAGETDTATATLTVEAADDATADGADGADGADDAPDEEPAGLGVTVVVLLVAVAILAAAAVVLARREE